MNNLNRYEKKHKWFAYVFWAVVAVVIGYKLIEKMLL